MRKYLVHYYAEGQHIKAVMEGDTRRAVMTQIRKHCRCAAISYIEEIAQMKAEDIAKRVMGARERA